MSFSLQGLNNHISSEITSQYWLQEVYPREIRELHVSGDLHIHDLNALSVYCCGWDLHDLLLTGFGGVSTKVESKPPKHFRTALGQIVNFFYTLQERLQEHRPLPILILIWLHLSIMIIYPIKKLNRLCRNSFTT